LAEKAYSLKVHIFGSFIEYTFIGVNRRGFYFLLVERSDILLSLGQKGGSQEAQPPGWGLRKIRERK
jgi:hypothetical protein